MEILNKLQKNGSTKRITTWTLIYLVLFQFTLASEDNMFSSGIDETTTFSEPTTHITLTPLLSTASTTEMINTTAVVPYTTTKKIEIPDCHLQTNFIAFGPEVDDDLFPPGDDNFIYECPSIEVPIDSKGIGCFYISTNGYITNGDILSYAPDKDFINKRKITLMPLWTDIDTRFSGETYYRIYDLYNKPETKRELNSLDNFFIKFGEKKFNPVWALKITWNKVVPYNAVENETMTFQFILATNGAVTNMAYIYNDCESTFLKTREALMGYVYPGYSYYHRDSLTSEIFDLGTKSNTRKKTKGVWIFALSKQYKRNAAQKCLQWSLQAERIFMSPGFTISCPCTLWQALRDFRFTRGQNNCFYLTFPMFGHSKVCCYLMRGRWQLRSLTSGYAQLYSSILNPNLWRQQDRRPYKDCCLDSNLCSIYTQYRPEDYCLFYRPPIRRFMFGDPHIQSLDGYVYTFNGLGEFELLNIYNASSKKEPLIKIQCRTNATGTNGRKATVFSAFAIRSGNTTIQISRRDNIEDVKIFGNDIELTQFYTKTSFTWRNGPFRLSEKSSENNSYIIQHDSQTMIGITLKNSLLQLSINIGYNMDDIKTNGLLGTYNKNTSDDLTTPDGTVISANSTEEEIYYKFGLTWRANNSIFYYETGESAGNYLFPDFVPTFLKINNDSAEYQKALEICTKDERDCIYDYLITQNTKLAKNTKLVEEKIDFNAMIVAFTSPTIDLVTKITVNINETRVRYLPVKDGKMPLRLDVIEKEHCNISIENRTVAIVITLDTPTHVKAAFQIRDSNNMSTSLVNLTVMVCPDCNNHGKCNQSVAIKPYEYACSCNDGWRGAYCNIDARCDPLNCPCTGPDDNYTCTCPPGYSFKKKCVDINECNVSNPCSQICTNTLGSFKCSCNDGYMLVNNTQCIDIDECARSLHNCQHLCENTDGSFKCSCYLGYNLTGTQCIKDTANDICQNKTDCSNATGCTLLNNKTTCFCNAGYTFNITTGICDDIDECDSITCINGTCENSEGSYACKCPIGRKLAKDGRTCEVCGQNKWGKNCANTCSGANCLTCNKITGCVCSPGYKGETCDEDIDECKDKDYCNNLTSTCQNTQGSATCVCNTGFILDSNEKCIDADECAGENKCNENAECTNTLGSYTCKCKKGYRGDGSTCTDIDECTENNTCEHICINQVGSFSCTCKPGYKLIDNRISCEKNTGLTYEGRLYIIIIGSIVGAVVIGLLITLWCCCYGCCCCACCRRRRPIFSTLEEDRYYLRDAFGSLTSSLRGRFLHEPLATDSAKAAKYLEDWSNFSPYSENNRQESGIDNNGWEDFGESTSSWGNIMNQYDNSREFRLERPKFKP